MVSYCNAKTTRNHKCRIVVPFRGAKCRHHNKQTKQQRGGVLPGTVRNYLAEKGSTKRSKPSQDVLQLAQGAISAGLTRLVKPHPSDPQLLLKCSYTENRDPLVNSYPGKKSNQFEIMTYKHLKLLNVFAPIYTITRDDCIVVQKLNVLESNPLTSKSSGDYNPANDMLFYVSGTVVRPRYTRMTKTVGQSILHHLTTFLEQNGLFIPDLAVSELGYDERGNIYILDWGNGISNGFKTITPDNKPEAIETFFSFLNQEQQVPSSQQQQQQDSDWAFE